MKKILQPLASLFMGLLILTGCNNADTSKMDSAQDAKPIFDLAIAKGEIEEANRNFMELVAKGDSVGLANCYTPDAKFMSAGAPAVVGRANIQSALAGIIKSGITKVDIKTMEVNGSEELIAEEGELTLYVGDQAVANEKYIVLWKKEDGQWKLFRDIFNSNGGSN
jgi:uncharacterized protein (TIGR02246 family)